MNFRLLEEIFFAHHGPGSGELLIAGLKVRKTVTSYTSNSGKNQDASVEFRWVGASGIERVLTRTSRFEANRSNDETRNWGLPR